MDTRDGNTEGEVTAADLAEVGDLIAGLEFTDQRACLQAGPAWIVYVHPWIREEAGAFDALICIHRRLAGGGTACGLRLSLTSERVVWLSNGLTDDRGQVWFRELPPGAFRVLLGSETSGAVSASRLIGGEVALAAQAGPTSLEEERAPGWRLYHLPDRRLMALLEEEDTHRTSLLVSSDSPEFAGAEVRFTLGDQVGTANLQQDEPGSQWIARFRLKGGFAALTGSLPHFAVTRALGAGGDPGND